MAGLAGYLMSLPSTRINFNMDIYPSHPEYLFYKRTWAGKIKDMIITFAVMRQEEKNYGIPIAWNAAVCGAEPQKRADILDPGITTLVCTYIPLFLYSICRNIKLNYYIRSI